MVEQKDYKVAWHPIKFDYKLLREVDLGENGLSTVKVEEHESVVTYYLTRPTGLANRSFPSTGRTEKISERMLKEVIENEKKVTTKGFFVRNIGKESVRIQTTEGCSYCRYGDCQFVWAERIIKIFEVERGIDWPKKSLYP